MVGIQFFQTGFIEMGHIGVGKLYEAFKNWPDDITEEYKIGKAEQMFAQEKAVEVRFVIIYTQWTLKGSVVIISLKHGFRLDIFLRKRFGRFL